MPKENKITKAELENRLDIIAELLAEGLSRREIYNFLDKHYSEWNVTQHQIQKYVTKCYAELQEAVSDKRKENVASALHRLRKLYRSATV